MRHIVQKLQYFYGLLAGIAPPPPPDHKNMLFLDNTNMLFLDNTDMDYL